MGRRSFSFILVSVNFIRHGFTRIFADQNLSIELGFPPTTKVKRAGEALAPFLMQPMKVAEYRRLTVLLLVQNVDINYLRISNMHPEVKAI